MLRRRGSEGDGGELESFGMSFASPILILLCLFLYLGTRVKPDSIRESNVVEAVRLHYGGAEGVKRLKEARATVSEIVEVAERAGFETVNNAGRYLLTLPGMKLFESGDDVVRNEYAPTLKHIASLVQRLGLTATIEGHTDDQPIATQRFRSNWELSAARAVSVLRIFEAAGVPEIRLSAAGRGEFSPVASNSTEEGRSKNRRVTIEVASPGEFAK